MLTPALEGRFIFTPLPLYRSAHTIVSWCERLYVALGKAIAHEAIGEIVPLKPLSDTSNYAPSGPLAGVVHGPLEHVELYDALMPRIPARVDTYPVASALHPYVRGIRGGDWGRVELGLKHGSAVFNSRNPSV